MMWNFTRVRRLKQRCTHTIFRPFVIYTLSASIMMSLWGCDDEESQDERVPQINLGGAMGGEGGGMAGDNTGGVTCARTFRFIAYNENPADVKIAGSFESPPWSGSVSLTDEDNDGTWLGSAEVTTGSHQYKVIVDGVWRRDLDAVMVVDDGMGGQNSVFEHECPFEPTCVSDAECSDS